MNIKTYTIWLLLALAVVAQVADNVTTRMVIAAGGHEANSVMAWLQGYIGLWGTLALKVGLAGLSAALAACIRHPLSPLVILPVFAWGAFWGVHNYWLWTTL